jgi:hypothetical protein
MKMKVPLQLLPSDRFMVITAMEEYRKGLSGMKLKMFDIAFNNVLQSKEHDGMELSYIIYALRKYAFIARTEKRITESNCYHDVAKWVDHALKRHQKMNGPRLKSVVSL